MVTSIATDTNSGRVAFEATKKIMDSFKGVHTICGLSNISFGLPKDKELMSLLIAAEAILGKDEYCMNYIKAFREGKI